MTVEFFGKSVIPFIVACCAFFMLTSKDNLVDEFLKGVKDGLKTSVGMFPSLLLLLCAVRLFFASSAGSFVTEIFATLLKNTGLPTELIPILAVRPFSGSAVTALANDLFKQYGPDSFVSKCACVLMGSSDTIIYTLAMYFSTIKIKKTRYALPVSFVVFAVCTIVSVIVSKYFFST